METSIIKNERPYVLTIDDDPDFNSLLELMLKKLHVDVVTTNGPESFFKSIVKSRPKLCLVDINLGKNYGAGFELIKLLRKEKFSDLPIIVISSMRDKKDIFKALELGATDYLTKPIEKVLLAEKVRQFIEIDKDAYDPFRLFPVPDRFSNLKIDLNLQVYKIGIEKISFLSNLYLAPETIITISESMFSSFGHFSAENKNIQVQVLQNKKIDESKFSEITCRICHGEREDILKANLKKWLFFREDKF